MTDYIAEFELKKNTLEFQGELCKNNPLQANLVINTSDKHFTFEQERAAAVWHIIHNLNKYPSVFAVDTAGQVQIPDDIQYINKNEVEVKFISAFAGKAYLN